MPLGFADLYSCVTTRGVFTSWKKVAQMTRERGAGDPFLSKKVASVGHLHLILTLQLAPFVADLAIIWIIRTNGSGTWMIEMMRWIADVSRGFVIACLAVCLILDLAPNLLILILSLSLFKPLLITHTMLVAGR